MKIILFVDILLFLIIVINGDFIKSFYKDGITELIQNSADGCEVIVFLLFSDNGDGNRSITFNSDIYTPIFNIENNKHMYRIKINIVPNNKPNPVYINTIINNQPNNITLSQPFNCIPINNNKDIQQNITNIRYDLFSNSILLDLHIYNSNSSIIYFNYNIDNSNNSNITNLKNLNNNPLINNSPLDFINNSDNNYNKNSSDNGTINNTSNNSINHDNSLITNPIKRNTPIITNTPNNLKTKTNNNNLLNSIQSSLPISANTTFKKPNNKLLVVKFQNIDRTDGVPASSLLGSNIELFNVFINNEIKVIPMMNDQNSYQLHLNLNCWNLDDLNGPINFQVKDQFNKISSIQIMYPLDSPVTSIWYLSPPPPPFTILQTFDNQPVDFLIFLNINKTQNPPLYIESNNNNNNISFNILPMGFNKGNYTIVLKHHLSASSNFNLSSPILSIKQIPYSISINNTIKSNYNIQSLDSSSLSKSSQQYKSFLDSNKLNIQTFNGTVNSPSNLFMSLKTSNSSGDDSKGNYYYKYSYPFGYYFGNSVSNYIFKVDHLFINEFQILEASFYCGYLDKQVLKSTVTSNLIDIKPPELLNILVNTSSNTESLIITIYASDDLSGIYEISIANQMYLHFEDIIDGNIQDAVFQSTLEFNSLLFDSQDYDMVNSFIKITDFAGNLNSYRYDDVYNSKFNSIPPLFPDIQLDTIESFKFTPNVIDTSLGSVSINLLIKSVYIDQTWIPKFSLIYPSIGIYSPSSSSINNGYYDSESGSFIIKFLVLKNSLPGVQDYVFQYPSWNSNYLSSKFGGDATILINNSNQISSYLGPIITLVNTSSNGNPIFINNSTIKEQEIYFQIQLNTNSKAFRNGVINITSNIDPIPYVFKFTIDDAIDTETKSIFKFTIPIASLDCISQEFEITGIELYDECNWKTFYNKYVNEIITQKPSKEIIIPPFDNSIIVTDNIISVICQDEPLNHLDRIPPELVKFDYNPKTIQFNSKDKVVFSFSVRDNLKINQRTNPVIYLMAENRQPQLIQSNIKSVINSTFIEYQASATINYGFSTRSAIIISIYNLMDTSINFRGYTTLDLIERSFPGIINVEISSNKTIPTINSYSLSSDNTELLIRGTKLLSNYVLGHFSALDGSINFDLKPINILSNQLIFKLPNDLNINFLSLVIEINDIGNYINNNLIITLNNYKSTFKPCGYNIEESEGNKCKNGGTCTETGCKCINDWYGPDCNSKLANYSLTLGNNRPSTNFVIDLNKQEQQYQIEQLQRDSSTSLSSKSSLSKETIEAEVSFFSIREIDINYNIINEFKIKNKWNVIKNYKSSKFNNKNATSTLYSNVFSTDTPIELIISQFPNYKVDFEFADQLYQLNPNSIKFTISIGKYHFKSPLSTLQLLFNSTIQDKSIKINNSSDSLEFQSCPTKAIGYTNKEKSNLSWISLNINNISIFGEFIQYGIIDNRAIQLNQNIDEKSIQLSENRISLFITITIPNYENNAIIDPQWSILKSLFGSPYNFNNQCWNNNQSNIFLSKNNLIIFITCLSFGLALTITIVILCFKYKWWIKYKTVILYDKILNMSFSEDK